MTTVTELPFNMLTFVWLASREGFTADHYEDEAVDVMSKNERGVPWLSAATDSGSPGRRLLWRCRWRAARSAADTQAGAAGQRRNG
jgi:hypothetical protein